MALLSPLYKDRSLGYLWDTNLLEWVPATVTSGGSGGTVDQGTAGIDPWLVEISGTVPVSATALPLPTGAATAALQTQPGVDIGDVTINNATGAAAVNVQDGGNSLTVDGTVAISAGSAVIGHVIADTGSTTAVTGNVTVVQGTATNLKVDASGATVPISAAALPLPSLAATSTKQSDGTQKAQVVDGSGNVIGATSNALDINIKSGNPTTIAVTQATATSLKAQAENYQGGTAVGSGNPLQVTLANTGANTSKILVTPDSVALPANQSVNVAQINGVTPLMGAGNTGTGSPRVTIATDQAVLPAGGNVAHDGADSGNPVKTGARALSYGANPTGVSNNDRTDLFANIAGVQFVISGHPNIITRRDNYTSAQTDVAIVTVSGGTKIVVVSATVAADAANSVKPAVRLGFGASATPTGAGTYLSHPGVPAGGGIREAGAVAGADGEDWRITCAVPTGGSLDIVTKYFTIES